MDGITVQAEIVHGGTEAQSAEAGHQPPGDRVGKPFRILMILEGVHAIMISKFKGSQGSSFAQLDFTRFNSSREEAGPKSEFLMQGTVEFDSPPCDGIHCTSSEGAGC